MDKEQTKQAILGFAEFFKGITGNQDLKIPSEIAEKYGIETMNYDDAISRQAVLSYIYNDLGLGDEENGADIERQKELEESYRYVKSLPSVKLQESCEDAISRQAVLELIANYDLSMGQVVKDVHALPSVNPQEPNIGYCKDCKYFEYDSVTKVDGVPLIVAHEICNRWGDECKSREDGYCFLFEPRKDGERTNDGV